MWVLSKNTLAGDLGVTPIIQCLASMLITSTLVHTDLHHHAVAPLSFAWPHVEHLPDPREITDRLGRNRRKSKKDTASSNEKSDSPSPAPEEQHPGDEQITRGFSYYLRMLIRFIFEGTENNSLLPIPNSKPLPIRIFLTAAQGAAIGIIFGLPVFLLFIIVLGPLYKHDNIVEKGWKWAPMVIKCVYGAVVGWITNPVIASLALGSQAEHHLIVISDEDEEGEIGQQSVCRAEVEGGVGVNIPIQEEAEEQEEYLSPPPPITAPGDSLRIPPSPISGGSLRLPNPTSPRSTNRPRALSNISATSSLSTRIGIRPPLTANCSTLPITSASTSSIRRGSVNSIPRTPRSAPMPSGEFGSINVPSSSQQAPPATPTMGSQRIKNRTRGATISTYISQSDSVGTNYSYALGGTGGRAKRSNRPRAISSLSGRGVQQPRVQVQADDAQVTGGSPKMMEREGAVDKLKLEVPITVAAKDRELGNGAKTPVWDVFGQVKTQDHKSTPIKDRKAHNEKEGEKGEDEGSRGGEDGKKDEGR
nr:hypothetical protein I302_08983 [Kwoniella bestiolae CBS 10118]OCF21310.1 hypothetical protein I302_08983 [Kwoniella bestiolae CBS 10118]